VLPAEFIFAVLVAIPQQIDCVGENLLYNANMTLAAATAERMSVNEMLMKPARTKLG